MTVNSPYQAVNITFLSLVNKLKHVGQLVNEIFIYSKDITPSQGSIFKGWRIFKMTAVNLGQKKEFNWYSQHSRVLNAVGYVDRKQLSSIDPTLFFLQTEAAHFQAMMTTVNEVNNDKTKIPDELFFVIFCLFVLMPRFMCKLIHNRCT